MVKKVFVYPYFKQENLVLGDKAKGILELDMLGFPVPCALIVSGSLYNKYSQKNDVHVREGIIEDIIEQICRHFSSPKKVLVSLRCGHKSKKDAPKIFPTSVLNLGLDQTYYKEALESKMSDKKFLDILRNNCTKHAYEFFKFIGEQMPHKFASCSLDDQMRVLIRCLFAYFLKLESQYSKELDTTIVIQKMVFGNVSNDSLTGMCYTRHPYSGEVMDYGVFIPCRQGMSLGGIHSNEQKDLSEMRDLSPNAYVQLKMICSALEEFYRDIRCLEFTVQKGELYILQNTVGNRTFRI